mmetsp:Transcript_21674/g.54556  ORF Transcript_21674/g.54556 Transcript_21674/m.54556 type:complete len:288 (+) Transcript_21674:247-1110(+)
MPSRMVACRGWKEGTASGAQLPGISSSSSMSFRSTMDRLTRSELARTSVFSCLTLTMLKPRWLLARFIAAARSQRALTTATSSAISPGGSSSGSRRGVCSRHCSATLMKQVLPRFFRPSAAGRRLPAPGNATGCGGAMSPSCESPPSSRSLSVSAAAPGVLTAPLPTSLICRLPGKPKQAAEPWRVTDDSGLVTTAGPAWSRRLLFPFFMRNLSRKRAFQRRRSGLVFLLPPDFASCAPEFDEPGDGPWPPGNRWAGFCISPMALVKSPARVTAPLSGIAPPGVAAA